MLPHDSVSSFPDLFSALDEGKNHLGIQSYAVSMTTLEEVFFQVRKNGEKYGWLLRKVAPFESVTQI